MTAALRMTIEDDAIWRVPGAASYLSAGTSGLVAGTRIATGLGWRPVEAVVPGDLVLTFDHGLQPVADIRHFQIEASGPAAPAEAAPVVARTGALGNAAPLVILPGQPVLLESDAAEDLFGEPFVAITGRDLAGVPGVLRRHPKKDISVTRLAFEREEAVFGAGGVMFLCDQAGDLFDLPGTPSYTVLAPELASAVLAGTLAPAGSTQ